MPNTVGDRTERHITGRLLPFLLLLYVVAYVDRVNISFAGLEMTRELGFSNEVFGFGSGIFFVGYCLLEMPGALLVETWSARKWIASVMLAWGLVAGFTGLIHTATQFSVIRFLLGVAEGGFFPAVVVYLTHWFRYQRRGKAVALFMAAIPLANAIGAPISGLLLRVHWMGLPGWRWLLILECLPALVCSVVTLYYLPDRPKDARWLTAEERDWISGELEREIREKREAGHHGSIAQSLRNPVVLAVAASYFLLNTSAYGLVIWLPKIVQRFSGLDPLRLSLLVAIPYVVSVPAMWINGWHSDKTGERRWHAGLATIAGALVLGLSQWPGASPTASLAALTLAAVGIMAYYGPLWALPSQVLSERSGAASFGFINMVANLGGFVGPYAVGFFTDRTGNYAAGVYVLVTTALLSAVAVALTRHRTPTAKRAGSLAAERAGS